MADATTALSASQTTPTTGAYLFMGFPFLALTTLTSPPPPPRRRVVSQGQRGRPLGGHATIKKPGLLGAARPSSGPRLGLPDAARSRGFQVPQEGSSSPFLYSRLWEWAVEGARLRAGVGAIAGRQGRAPANSGGTGGPKWRGFWPKLGVSAKNNFFLDVQFSSFLGVILSKFTVENGYDHF